MRKCIDFFLERSLLVHLLTISILSAGCFFAYNLRKEIFPPVDFGVISVWSFYPGSSAEDVENLVTIPAERALKGVAGFKRMNALSMEGSSGIIIEVDQDYDLDKVYEDVKNAIDSVRDFPEEVEAPTIRSATNTDRKIISVVLTGKEYQQIRMAAKSLQRQLELIDEVKQVGLEGYLVDDIRIEVSPEKLNFYELTVGQVQRAVRNRNLNLPAGRIEAAEGNLFVRTISEFGSVKEIENVVIRSNASGENVKVSDVAKVTRRPVDSDIRQRSNGKRAIFLNIVTKAKSDIIRSTDKVKRTVEWFFSKKGRGVSYEVNHHYADSLAYWVKRRLNVLIDNGTMGFALVFICLLAFLNFRASVVTTLGAPIAFTTSFIVMAYFDVSVNLISMFSLIMVLGMLVDDSIIVAEYYFQKLEQGLPPKEAARQAAYETVAPVLATIFTTMVAFGAFFFMGGTMGKFVRTIPTVVIICLAASILECYFILPSHLADFVRLDKKKNNRKPWYYKMTRLYRRYLAKALKFHWQIVGGFLALLVATLFVAKTMRFELFPGDDIRTVFLQVKGPVGAPLDKTDKIMDTIERVAIEDLEKDELEQTKVNVGVMFEERRSKKGTHYGSLTLYLTPPNDRKRSTDEIVTALVDKLKPVVRRDGYMLTTSKLKGGPPRGKAVDIEITGDDLDELFGVAKKIEAELKKVKGVTTTEIDFEDGKKQIAVKVKEEEARRLGISARDIAMELRRTFSGDWFSKIKEQEDDVEIKIFLDEQSRSKVETLNLLYIMNNRGQRIPMAKVVEFEEKPSAFVIRRKNRRRVISITADINFRIATPMGVAKSFGPVVDRILNDHPHVARYFGGENEGTKESIANLFKAFGIAIICIFLILVVMFGSITQPIMVMTAIPLGLIGVVLTFKVAAKPLSFMALLGIVALIGVVVNDSIVLVNFTNKLRKFEKNVYKAVLKASVSRFRPVLLTTVTTVAGLLFLAHPILARIFSFGINKDSDAFLQPMAMSFAWGLAFASTITLFFIPSLYVVMVKINLFFVKIFKGRMSHAR